MIQFACRCTDIKKLVIKYMTNLMNALRAVETDQLTHYLICSPFFVLIIFALGLAARVSCECFDEAQKCEKMYRTFSAWCLIAACFLFIAIMLSMFILTLGYLFYLVNFSFGASAMHVGWICLIVFSIFAAVMCILGMKKKVN